MRTLRLPQQLPPSATLTAINANLRSGQWCLDWSDVRPPVLQKQLEVLFQHLNLVEHFDIIGGDTIPEAFTPLVEAAFNALATQRADQTIRLPHLPSQSTRLPELWLPDDETHPAR
ncbi:hypothetical protein [Dictyobacter kobayashii]|uniref:Uncharacterized protein n=1 Tax=Dictyobacter kobayashii TaxID=2014872 RepID=A0A402AYJ8_9CHLR|nr:hypothetical protein [Dictyobacter kobayashii]GCE24147.1 hypothetical protein KDK_79470 [Dictyobacter kobayashii]